MTGKERVGWLVYFVRALLGSFVALMGPGDAFLGFVLLIMFGAMAAYMISQVMIIRSRRGPNPSGLAFAVDLSPTEGSPRGAEAPSAEDPGRARERAADAAWRDDRARSHPPTAPRRPEAAHGGRGPLGDIRDTERLRGAGAKAQRPETVVSPEPDVSLRVVPVTEPRGHGRSRRLGWVAGLLFVVAFGSGIAVLWALDPNLVQDLRLQIETRLGNPVSERASDVAPKAENLATSEEPGKAGEENEKPYILSAPVGGEAPSLPRTDDEGPAVAPREDAGHSPTAEAGGEAADAGVPDGSVPGDGVLDVDAPGDGVPEDGVPDDGVIQGTSAIAPAQDRMALAPDTSDDAPNLANDPSEVAAVGGSEAIRSRGRPVSLLPEAAIAELKERPAGNGDRSVRDLLSMWGVAAEGATKDSACRIAEGAGLECLKGRGDLDTLAAYNRPALVTVASRGDGDSEALLTEIRPDGVTIVVDGNEVRDDRDAVSQHWTGDFTLLWDAPDFDYRRLRLGDSGPQVVWLRKTLEALTDLPLSRNGKILFDRELMTALMTYQRTRGLEANGIVGPSTLMQMNSDLATRPIPKLTATAEEPVSQPIWSGRRSSPYSPVTAP